MNTDGQSLGDVITMPPKIIVVVGPTAVGKTRLAVELAQRLGRCEIVSADSMQVYAGFDIGSAKATEAEMGGIPHHLISIADIAAEPFTVRDFVRLGRAAITDICSRDRHPIVVGGTFYYVSALLRDTAVSHDDACFPIPLDDEDDLFTILSELDPDRAAKLHPNDRRRVRGSIQASQILGRPHGEVIAEASHDLCYRAIVVWLEAGPGAIAGRIDARVEKMLEDGIVDENRRLYRRLTPGPRLYEVGVGQAIGFKEFRQCYGEDYAEAGDRAERVAKGAASLRAASLRYAQRQSRAITKWLGNLPTLPVCRLDTTDSAQWSLRVLAPAVQICTDFLSGAPVDHDTSWAHFDRPPLAPAPEIWRKHTCDICSGRTLNGSHEYRVHLLSRSHRRAASKRHRVGPLPPLSHNDSG